MANRIHYPIFKAFTTAGALAASYKLYTYEAGTTTLLETYKTSDGAAGASHTNPIILDALGEAEVFVTEAVKLTLTDADDNVQDGWPVDDIDPTTVDADDVSYTASGGMVSDNVQDAIDELVTDVAAKADPGDVEDSGWGTMQTGSTMSGVIGMDASIEDYATDKHDIAFTAGTCKDSTNAAIIYSTGVITKQSDAVWAAGDDAGGLLTGTTDTESNASTVYLFVVMGDGAAGVDFAFLDIDEVDDIATLVDGAGFTYYKVIGFARTNAANGWSGFTQNGDHVHNWTASEWVLAVDIGTSFATVTEHPDYIAEDFVELIGYGVRDAQNDEIYASDDGGDNVSFAIGRAGGVADDDTNKSIWGDTDRPPPGLKPYLSTREFRSSANTLDLLIQAYKLKR